MTAPGAQSGFGWRFMVHALGSVEIQDSHGGLVLIQAPKREQSMTRFILTDAQWARIEPHCLGKATDPGRTGGDARLFFEAVLWIARTGSPWRDLPDVFGRWNTVFKRFRHWVMADVFKRIFDALSGDPDLEFAMIDGSIVKVHRHGQGVEYPFENIGHYPVAEPLEHRVPSPENLGQVPPWAAGARDPKHRFEEPPRIAAGAPGIRRLPQTMRLNQRQLRIGQHKSRH